jgi:hypothetical protein
LLQYPRRPRKGNKDKMAEFNSIRDNVWEEKEFRLAEAAEAYWSMLMRHIYPQSHEWFVIAMNMATFVFGVIGTTKLQLLKIGINLSKLGNRNLGNVLVLVSVCRQNQTFIRSSSRSSSSSRAKVTNMFLAHLAISDLVRIIFCLPPTVIWDTTETWVLGIAGCKAILFLENVTITFNILALAYVAHDRRLALANPFAATGATASLGKARLKLSVLWLISVILAFPEPVTLTTTQPKLDVETILFTQCVPQWSDETDQIYVCAKAALLYLLPVAFIAGTYAKGDYTAETLLKIFLRIVRAIKGKVNELSRATIKVS